MKLFDLYESQVNEIQRLHKYDYEGGKEELYGIKKPDKKAAKPLPGGSGFEYAITKNSYSGMTTIVIIDPNAPAKDTGSEIVAKLSLYNYKEQPFKNAVKVSSITVDEDYRGKGLAKALYGIVLTIMKKTLVAGGEQTPGGRRNWMSLASIPGVEVKGFVQIDTDDVEFNPNDWPDSPAYQQAKKQREKEVDAVHDNLMRMGGQFLGKSRYAEYWAFDVLPGKDELKQAVKTPMNTLYDQGDAATGMFAVWTGK